MQANPDGPFPEPQSRRRVFPLRAPYAMNHVRQSDDRVKGFDDRAAMAATLRRIAKDGDVMLFKGSHGMHMELVLEQFLKEDK